MSAAPLHVVLFEPEIPPNTGNIARLCGCTGCQLHLVHPLGFSIDDRSLRRAGLDYWQYLSVVEHADWAHVRDFLGCERAWYGLSTKAERSLWQAEFHRGDVLVMGPETRGLPAEVLADLHGICIPQRSDAPVRSLNLSSACAVASYEALRQIGWGQNKE
ncbi:MAG: tRNA (cytidine(34)-2'-O)-methyltransferase [Mariprofundales bacterium]|nr:tRNA (cytidine(34)-2'-O)-methyltransferase [Mariprofundales bacterium]